MDLDGDYFAGGIAARLPQSITGILKDIPDAQGNLQSIRQVDTWPTAYETERGALRTDLDDDTLWRSLNGLPATTAPVPSSGIPEDDSSVNRGSVAPIGAFQLRRELGTSWPHLSLLTKNSKTEKWCKCCSIHPWKSCLRTYLISRINHSRRTDSHFGLGCCFSVRYSPNGSSLAVGYENGTIDIMGRSADRNVHRLRNAHADGVNGFCWLDEYRFLSCSDDSFVCSWDLRLLRKPTQCIFSPNLIPPPFGLDYGNDLPVKDMYFRPDSSEYNSRGTVLFTGFSNWIFRMNVDSSFLLSPLGPYQLPDQVMRSAMLPDTSQLYGNILVSFNSRRKGLASYFTMSEMDKGIFLPSYVHPQAHQRTWLDDNKRENRDNERRHVYRSMKADPLGTGFLMRKTLYSNLRDYYSFTAYYTLTAGEGIMKHLPVSVDMKFFMRDKTSDLYFQECSFSPSGLFIASPQDRRVDVLTNGSSALPFSECGEKPTQFSLATHVSLPKCSDILCCDVSPSDGVSVVSGCTLGHVHFLQPVL